jgi:hypothetical protein
MKKKKDEKKRFSTKKKKKKKKTVKIHDVPQRPLEPRLERPGEPRALLVDGENAPVMHIVQHAPELLRQRRKPRLQGRVHRLDPRAVSLHEKKKKKRKKKKQTNKSQKTHHPRQRQTLYITRGAATAKAHLKHHHR